MLLIQETVSAKDQEATSTTQFVVYFFKVTSMSRSGQVTHVDNDYSHDLDR